MSLPPGQQPDSVAEVLPLTVQPTQGLLTQEEEALLMIMSAA